jgi:branched-chain amino acid transport system ATP-binding protein
MTGLAQETDVCLEVRDVSVEFGGLHALSDVSLSVRPGRVLGVVGPNGAGKTTLFNVISGVVKPTRGTVHLGDTDVTALPPHLRARAGLSRTFQNLALNDEMTAIENVLVGSQRHVPLGFARMTCDIVTGKARRREQTSRSAAAAALAKLELSAGQDRLVAELPFGSRRRIDMARALAGEPRTLLLDEPFSGLGDRERPLMSSIIRTIRDEARVGVVLVEHDMNVVADLCDDVLVLNEGSRLAFGPPAEVLADPVVQEAYLGPQLKRKRGRK